MGCASAYEGRLRNDGVVMHTAGEGKSCAGNLWNPPEAAQRRVAAGHHAASEIVHDGRADLGGGVDGVGVSKGTKERVTLGAVISGDGAASRPCIQSGSAMARSQEGVPELLLARGRNRALDSGLYRRDRKRLNGGLSGNRDGVRLGNWSVRQSGA